jgi:hypothetical protein
MRCVRVVAPQVGDVVVLTHDYAEYNDARSGPLKPGDQGEVMAVNPSSGQPYSVRAVSGSTRWWYAKKALQRAMQAAEAPPPASPPPALLPRVHPLHPHHRVGVRWGVRGRQLLPRAVAGRAAEVPLCGRLRL